LRALQGEGSSWEPTARGRPGTQNGDPASAR
jgi:hypothetical protein